MLMYVIVKVFLFVLLCLLQVDNRCQLQSPMRMIMMIIIRSALTRTLSGGWDMAKKFEWKEMTQNRIMRQKLKRISEIPQIGENLQEEYTQAKPRQHSTQQ